MRHPLLQKFDLFNAPIAEHTRDADGLPRHNMIGAARSRMLHEVESGIAVVSDGVMSIGAFVRWLGVVSEAMLHLEGCSPGAFAGEL